MGIYLGIASKVSQNICNITPAFIEAESELAAEDILIDIFRSKYGSKPANWTIQNIPDDVTAAIIKHGENK